MTDKPRDNVTTIDDEIDELVQQVAKGIRTLMSPMTREWVRGARKTFLDQLDDTAAKLIEIGQQSAVGMEDLVLTAEFRYNKELKVWAFNTATCKANTTMPYDTTEFSVDLSTVKEPSVEDKAFQALIHKPMTDEEKEAQRRSFVYGNVAVENPDVTRELVDEVADDMAVKDRDAT